MRGGVKILLSLFDRLGLPVAEGKLEGPSFQLIFLVLEIDTQAMELDLPEGKLRELQTLIQSWVWRRSCVQ